MKKNKFYQLGVISVDSGIICIADPCHLVNEKSWARISNDILDNKKDMRCGVEREDMFISKTVNGDGLYNVDK